MSNIVERLQYFPPGSCERDAADEIERLRGDKAELLSLLRMTWPHVVSEGDDTLASIITAAIAKESK